MKLQPILRAIRKADHDYQLIKDNDSIAVGLSGGKDSMLLLLALEMYTKFKDKNFKVIGIHIDVGFEHFEHDLLKQFANENNLHIHIEKTKIFDILKKNENKGKIQCSLCSTLKKGILFEKAKELGCNKIALGHHADDAIETLFLNMIHGSKIATFLPKQYMSRMDMDMIRPMIYLKEQEIIDSCQSNKIPSVKRVCPNDGYTQRQDIKDKLQLLYKEFPMAHDNFITSLSNLDQLQLWKK